MEPLDMIKVALEVLKGPVGPDAQKKGAELLHLGLDLALKGKK